MNTLDTIHSLDSFQHILDRERSRADRTGQIFSLVLFSFNHWTGSDGESLERLCTVLVNKVRISDEVGWYEEGKSLGALLPGTTAEGALQFIEIIRQKIGEVASSLESTVYTYPNTLNNFVRSPESEDKKNTFLKYMSLKNVTTVCSHFTQPSGESVKPMEPLFARPNPLWKRVFDFAAAILLLIILSPLLFLISLFIKIVSPGPVFYRQQRIGFQGKPFLIWKFRTMHVNNDAEGHRRYLNHLLENDVPMTKMDDGGDERIIPFGKFLRYYCLDELPQLFNVLKREMSLIGPRPCLPYEAEKYLLWHARRFDVLPGMTGLWQVTGKNRRTFKEMIRLDIRYSRKISPALDTKILLLTAPAILGMVSEPIVRGKGVAINRDMAVTSPSRREQTVQ